MKMKKWILAWCCLMSLNAVAEECGSEHRTASYESLITSLKYMDNELPAFSPKEQDFYADVNKKYPQNPTKYSRLISSNEYLIWDNSQHLNHLIGLANDAKKFANNNDYFNELLMITNLLMRVISDHSQYIISYRDSAILFERKLVSESYVKEAKMISFRVASLGLCIEKPLLSLEQK
jgi:hypothetical protein